MKTASKRAKRTALERVYRVRMTNMRLLESSYRNRTVFAAVLGVSTSHLSHLIGENPTKVLGEQAARDYEAKLNLHSGWLDIPR